MRSAFSAIRLVRHETASKSRLFRSYISPAPTIENPPQTTVDPCKTVEFPGKPYAVSIDDATTVKLVQPLANGLRLSPNSTDPTHQQTILDFNVIDPERVSIVGRVVWYTLPLDWSFTSPE